MFACHLSYFVGIFGFPWLGGHLIVRQGPTALVAATTCLAALECLIALVRHLAARRRAATARGHAEGRIPSVS